MPHLLEFPLPRTRKKSEKSTIYYLTLWGGLPVIHVDDALWFLMEKDPGLTPYSGEIRMHMDRYNDRR